MAKKLKEKKTPRRKPKYNVFSCVAYIYKLLWKYKKSLVFTGVFTVPVSLALSAIALYTPSLILSSLEKSERFSSIALVIVGLLLAKTLFELVNNFISQTISDSEFFVHGKLAQMFAWKLMDRDRYHDIDVSVKEIDERARNSSANNHSAGVHFPMDFSNMVTQVLNFFLFGSVISMLNPIVIVLLAVGAFLDAAVSKWLHSRNWVDQDVRNSLQKKINYLSFGLSRDFKYAKDVRLYSMQKPIHDKMYGLYAESRVEQKKLEARSIFTSVMCYLIVLLREGAAYAFLIYKAVQGEVDASSFVLYLSAIGSMAGLMGGIMGTFNRIYEGSLQISDFREFLELQDKLNRGTGIPIPKGPFSIEFKKVSFQYPKGEKKILDKVSFKIEAGEKIALVGLNGAGKTTLTMLMCGMLLPDEGEILLDGHTLYEYNRDEMYSLFGFVPQNYNLLPVSIAKNIASALSDEEIDYERLQRCIEISGLSEKIASLPAGYETPLYREVNKDGIELSGGEKQKLLLARLMYKAPQFIILDEPTAALDPIAEDKLYRRYNEIAENATSVFISHRLASTRFCDRIFLLDGACFAECGTHDELMELGGKYKELFDIQSKYYREEAKNCEN